MIELATLGQHVFWAGLSASAYRQHRQDFGECAKQVDASDVVEKLDRQG